MCKVFSLFGNCASLQVARWLVRAPVPILRWVSRWACPQQPGVAAGRFLRMPSAGPFARKRPVRGSRAATLADLSAGTPAASSL